jgi:hypothetical protein
MPSKASLHHSRQIRLIIIITLFSHLIFACHVFEDFRTLSQPRQADYNNHIMLHYITLHYITLHYIILYYIILYLSSHFHLSCNRRHHYIILATSGCLEQLDYLVSSLLVMPSKAS